MTSPSVLYCQGSVARQPSHAKRKLGPFSPERINPLAPFAAGLAAHARMPRGHVYVNLTDDPETRDEVAAEAQRRRQLEWQRRKRIAEALRKPKDEA